MSALDNKLAIRLPAEWEPHACCYLAWAVHREWGVDVDKVKNELCEVIRAIAEYEPVRLLAPKGEAIREAHQRLSSCANITVVEAPVDDIWMRDIAPTFAICEEPQREEIVAIDWNFNAWGGTKHRRPRRGDLLAKYSESIFGVRRIGVDDLHAEGGAIITDGCGTIITTRSCLLNPNRNPPISGENRERMIETALAGLGARQVIWLKGDPDELITSGHVDSYVLFAPSGIVLVETFDDSQGDVPVWRANDVAVLETARDADGKALKVVPVFAPKCDRSNAKSEYFAPCYLNAYVANGAVITGRFGDTERDDAAKEALGRAFPGRRIVMLQIDTIAEGGGGVHCLAQPVPMTGHDSDGR